MNLQENIFTKKSIKNIVQPKINNEEKTVLIFSYQNLLLNPNEEITIKTDVYFKDNLLSNFPDIKVIGENITGHKFYKKSDEDAFELQLMYQNPNGINMKIGKDTGLAKIQF